MLILEQFNRFSANLDQGENVNDSTRMFFILEETKETVLEFPQRTLKVL